MGYNGGVNKRGYYRRNNGMYKKSSYKSGEKLMGGLISGGLSLLFSLPNINIESTQFNKQNPKEINLKRFRTKKIMYCIITLLCPICTILTYEMARWWMFFAVILWGVIEMIFALSINIGEDFDEKYIIQPENYTKTLDTISKILIFSKYILIITLILNTLPFIVDLLDTIGIYRMHEPFTIITTVTIFSRMYLLFLQITTIMDESKRLNITIKNCIKKVVQPSQHTIQ